MPESSLVLVGVNACASAVLLVTAAAKLASPAPLARALRELVGRHAYRFDERRVRLLAIVEVVVAVGLLIPGVRMAGAVGAGGLGLGFAVAGLMGVRRGSSLACGCFGRVAGRPLGPANVAMGLVFVGVLAVDALIQPGTGAFRHDAAAGPAAAATMALVLSVLLHRDLVRRLLAAPSAPKVVR